MREQRESAHTARLAKGRAHLIAIALKAGSQKALGQRLGVSQQVVNKWTVRGWVPLPRAQEIEAIYGVPRALIADPRMVDLMAPIEFDGGEA